MNRREAMIGAMGLAAVAVAAPVAAMVPDAQPEGFPPRLDHRSVISRFVKRLERQDGSGAWVEEPWVIRLNLARGRWYTHFSRCQQRGRMRLQFDPVGASLGEHANGFARDEIRGYIADCQRFGCTWDEESLTLTGPENPSR